jgi:HD-GYP domain-containing protein (c-di-GMP phosphodiesterase class II)
LFDIGKVNMPDGLLTKEGPLNSAELKLLRSHVDFGVDILSKAGAVPTVLEVARDHHERHDGSGYPAGKSGGDIPVFAQIVGLADAYDAMISNRVYRGAMSHEAAVRELYEMRGSAFNAEILEQFIQCLGTYPAGSLVELTTGDVAIVMQQNQVRRLRPRVMLVLDSDKNPIENFPIINLLSETEDSHGRFLAIAKSLDPGSYGIDPAEYFI